MTYVAPLGGGVRPPQDLCCTTGGRGGDAGRLFDESVYALGKDEGCVRLPYLKAILCQKVSARNGHTAWNGRRKRATPY